MTESRFLMRNFFLNVKWYYLWQISYSSLHLAVLFFRGWEAVTSAKWNASEYQL